MEQRNLRQRYAIKFAIKPEECASVTFFKLKQAYGTNYFRMGENWWKMNDTQEALQLPSFNKKDDE